MRRRIEARASSWSPHEATAPRRLPAVPTVPVEILAASSQSPEVFEDKDMTADLDVDRPDKTSFERQVEELGMLMTALGQPETHVAEIFERGRFTVRAPRFDLRPSTALDLRTGYDVNKEADRLRVRECLKKEKPLLLVGSPRCAASSQLQSLASDSKRWRAMAREGLHHLTFVCELYKDQIDSRRFFLHEHPRTSEKLGP